MSIFVLLLVLVILTIVGLVANKGYYDNVILKSFDNVTRKMSLYLYSLCVLGVIACVCYINFTSGYTRLSVLASTSVLVLMAVFLLWRIVKLIKVSVK